MGSYRRFPMDDEDPPVRRFKLKTREVEPVDKVARPGDGTAISVRLIHLQNNLAAEQPAQLAGSADRQAPTSGATEGPSSIFKQKEFVRVDPPAAAGDENAISVEQILLKNRAAAHERESELIAMPARRRSRRHRDFLVVVSVAAISAGIVAVVFRESMEIVGLALLGIVFLTAILAWVIYGIMDRY
jgi:hypothetical protein